MINIISFSALLLASLGAAGQTDSSGVYRSASDFQRHKLTFASACPSNRNSVKFRERSFVTVLHNGQKYKYRKQDLFGYRDCSGSEFRIFQNQKYEVLSRDNIILYKVYEDVGFGDMVLYESSYYFSEKVDSPIYPLTERNLDWVYRKNFEFVKRIHLSFRKDEDLADYVEKTRQYKLILLYLQSIGMQP